MWEGSKSNWKHLQPHIITSIFMKVATFLSWSSVGRNKEEPLVLITTSSMTICDSLLIPHLSFFFMYWSWSGHAEYPGVFEFVSQMLQLDYLLLPGLIGHKMPSHHTRPLYLILCIIYVIVDRQSEMLHDSSSSHFWTNYCPYIWQLKIFLSLGQKWHHQRSLSLLLTLIMKNLTTFEKMDISRWCHEHSVSFLYQIRSCHIHII